MDWRNRYFHRVAKEPVLKTALELSDLFPRAKPGILEAIDTVGVPLAHLINPIRFAYFMAQCAHESAGFQFTKELGSARYLNRYEGRRDLGNTEIGDGVRFCGRGIIQVTGRSNYAACGEWTGLPLLEYPELLEDPGPAVRSACWYWMTHNLNPICDAQNFTLLTRRINGGTNGMASRNQWLAKIKTAINGD